MRPYMEADFKEISQWCEAQKVNTPPEWSIPKAGFIEPGIACGFLIRMENAIGKLDFYIGNPASTDEARNAALDEITEGLIKYGKHLNLKMIVCDSNIPAIQKRAVKHGLIGIGTFKSFYRSL